MPALLAACDICAIGLDLASLPNVIGGAMLLWAALAKLVAVARPASRSLVPRLARFAILIELALGSVALSTQAELISSTGLVVIGIAFAAYIRSQLQLAAPPACACFGSASTVPLNQRSYARAAVVSVLGLFGLVVYAAVGGSDLAIGTWFGTVLVGAVTAGALIQFTIAYERGQPD